MANAERIANALGGAKRTPEGYLCRCPCHDDKSASLSLAVSDKGGIVLNCFAGCSWQDIKAEIERRGLLDKSPAVRKGRYDGAKFYYYYDLVGNTLCRKVKMPDKKMWFERFESGAYVAGLAGMTVPLYNLAAVTTADTVYLCEGEKDAETLITRGLCGTTNHAGAKSWAPHLTEQLKGKTVVLIPDNDEAGRKRVAIVAKALQGVVKELRVFIPDNVPEKGDITDWVEAGGDVTQIFSRSVVSQKGAVSKKASRDDYYALFDTVWNSPRRCIFNEKLMHLDASSGLWNPCVNSLEIVKSEALVLNETRESKFSVSAVQPHFFAYEASKPPEFLVDIPEWDGIDRIGAMASLITPKLSSGITVEAISELLKEWCGMVFQRLHNPMIQNRILVLQGGQGIGKDTWTSMLVDGLGQFCIPLAVVKEDKDTYLNLHRGLVMKISEFDKTAKAEVSTLKDIITAPSTNLRAPYDKDSKLRLSRCSFISSANAENLLRDSTGNRRFLIFEIESIQYAYEGWSAQDIRKWQMDCLAQMVKLAEDKYKASESSWRMVRDYLEQKTPVEFATEIAEQFARKIKVELTLTGSNEILLTDVKVEEAIIEVAKVNQIRPTAVKAMIRSKFGVFRRFNDTRVWVLRLPVDNNQTTQWAESQEQLPF